MAVALLPQLLKLLREKTAQGVSLVMFLTLFTGYILWITYGIMKKDPIITISNIVSFLINVCTMIVTMRYARRGQ